MRYTETLIIAGIALFAVLLLSSCSVSESLDSTENLSLAAEKSESIAETPKYFIDMEIKPVDTFGRAGELFSFSSRITSRGSQSNFAVQLHHEIRSKDDQTILVSKDETVGLETISSKRTTVILPKDAKPGRYVVETHASYESGSADSSFEFDLEPAVEVKKPAESAQTPASNITLVSSVPQPHYVTNTPPPPTPIPDTGTIHEVQVSGFGFEPLELTIKVGDTVRWTNTDINSHTATGAGFDLVMRGGDSAWHTFTEARSYAYTDTFSGTAPGTVNVEE